ncbi:hypothetical protein glysoja_047719 [Glycine soja]|uniref:Uncharacterized protein n=1 Tax=Glycine soja TaxID=3848 RepID=A0A0B2NXC8_GLYSO|nr:hypothetical protein glysoja_047719 [Glycine soja]
MHNVSQNPGTNDGRAYVTKGKVAGAMHKKQPKPSYDAKSEAAQVVNGCNGYSVYSGPAPVSGYSSRTIGYF